jgi:hypothetical protein
VEVWLVEQGQVQALLKMEVLVQLEYFVVEVEVEVDQELPMQILVDRVVEEQFLQEVQVVKEDIIIIRVLHLLYLKLQEAL